DLATDLRRFLDGQPTAVRPKGFFANCVLWCQHSTRIRDAGAFTVFLMILLAAWTSLAVIWHADGAVRRGSFWPFNNAAIPQKHELAVLHLCGSLGVLFLPLFFSGMSMLRRKYWSEEGSLRRSCALLTAAALRVALSPGDFGFSAPW